MSTEHPWEVIRAAADKVEKLAAAATPTPWKRGENRTVVGVIPNLLSRTVRPWGLKIARNVDDVDRDWICALSPAVAEPLVAWLRGCASCPPAAALEFARKILGEQP